MEERLSDRIILELRAGIIDGSIKPNVFLVESEVAAQYGVSKAPVKAALQALTQEGYLICFPRKGYMVSTISVDDYEHVRELREHIEVLSVTLAIRRASDEEILSLRELIRCNSQERNPFKTNNTKFHLRLAEISQNPYIEEVLVKLLGQTSRYAFMARVDDSFHEEIINALLERNTQRALENLEKDLNPQSPKYTKR